MSLIGRIRVGGEHDGFTHAVTLQNGVTRALLPLGESFNQQWRRTRDEQTHVACSLLGQGGLGQEAHIQSGHPHEDRRFRHFGDDKLGIKLGHPYHFAAIDQGTVNGHKQTMHMKNRQRVNEHIALLPRPISFESLGVAEHVAVGQHGAFAAACRTTGVQNGCQVVGFFDSRFVLIALLRCAL